MTIIIGADHRGFALKNQLVEYLQNKNIRVDDVGALEYDALDDFSDYARQVARAVQQQPDTLSGIVICGSGVGVSIAVNRFKNVRCALGYHKDEITSAREHNHVNVLALPADFVTLDQAKEFVDIFLATEPKLDEKYLRRIKKVDE